MFLLAAGLAAWVCVRPLHRSRTGGWFASNSLVRRGGCGGVLTTQEVDYQLIGAHHDGGVGDLPDQVGGEAAVQGPVALLFGHCS